MNLDELNKLFNQKKIFVGHIFNEGINYYITVTQKIYDTKPTRKINNKGFIIIISEDTLPRPNRTRKIKYEVLKLNNFVSWITSNNEPILFEDVLKGNVPDIKSIQFLVLNDGMEKVKIKLFNTTLFAFCQFICLKSNFDPNTKNNFGGSDFVLTNNSPINIFISYAHSNETSKKELMDHLSPLTQNNKLIIFQDRAIDVGANFDDAIKMKLLDADIIMFLVSPQLLASNYINSVELRIAIDRHNKKDVILVPVIITHVLWQESIFKTFLVSPTDGVPIDSNKWDTKNAAYLDVAQKLNAIIGNITSKKT